MMLEAQVVMLQRQNNILAAIVDSQKSVVDDAERMLLEIQTGCEGEQHQRLENLLGRLNGSRRAARVARLEQTNTKYVQ